MIIPSKALTLTQPWASLVALEEKTLETRSWSTSFRGPIAIHAAKGMPAWAKVFLTQEPFRSALERHRGPAAGEMFGTTELPRGQILCVCNLVEIVRVGGEWKHKLGARLTENELEFGDYSEGRYVWVLDQVQRIEPIFARGALSLWEIENDLQISLGKQLQEANSKRPNLQDPLQRGKGLSPDRVLG